MDRLTDLENRSIFIIREAVFKFRRPALLWSVGKDSTTLLWMCRKAFFGKVPFPVIHIDTGYKFPEMIRFRDEMAGRWGLDLIIAGNEEPGDRGIGPDKGARMDCCNRLKTVPMKRVISEHGFDSILVGIRRDEHGVRAKERVFSPRDALFQWNYQNQPAELWDQYKSMEEEGHVRVHPLLHMTEGDIWAYILREKIPVVDLYFSRGGKRFRSIGCAPCCGPEESNASTVEEVIMELEGTRTPERAGRAQDKEDVYTMQKLRALGYM